MKGCVKTGQIIFIAQVAESGFRYPAKSNYDNARKAPPSKVSWGYKRARERALGLLSAKNISDGRIDSLGVFFFN